MIQPQHPHDLAFGVPQHCNTIIIENEWLRALVLLQLHHQGIEWDLVKELADTSTPADDHFDGIHPKVIGSCHKRRITLGGATHDGQ